jgi:hypothetical protein
MEAMTASPCEGRQSVGLLSKWREISPLELVYNVSVLTEDAYRQRFDHRNLPPLPDAAFRSGWRSPLVA